MVFLLQANAIGNVLIGLGKMIIQFLREIGDNRQACHFVKEKIPDEICLAFPSVMC